MNTEALTSIAGWLLTVAVHGGLLLLVASIIDRAWPTPQRAWRELMWRFALFGGVITASVQPLMDSSPLAGRWHLAGAQISIVSPPEFKSDVGAPSGGAVAVESASPLRAKLASVPMAAASIAKPYKVSSAVYWPAWIIGIWLMGALFALIRMARKLLRLRRSLHNVAALPAHGVMASDVSALAKCAAVRKPRLYSLIDIPSPIAATGGRIIVPAWAMDSLDRRQLRAMLAHEFAHLSRRDPEWKLFIALWRSLFWFLLFARSAQRRLDEISELACDAFAAQHTGNARSVAECLAACVEHRTRTSAYALAPAMAARESPLMHRIDCLLEGITMETATAGARVRAAALTLLAGCTLSLPAITFFDAEVAHAAQTPPKEQAAVKHSSDSASSSVSIHSDDGKEQMSVSVSDSDHKFAAKVDGKIAFSADETDVASLSAGGTASFEETRAGVTHRIEFAERAGKLERRYFVDAHEQPFDAAGGIWLANLLPALIRETGLGAEARVRRLYADGGAARVLDEIERIHSEYARGIYVGTLLDSGELTPAELERTLKIAGDVHSDYERHQVLSNIFAKQKLSAAQQVTFLRQVAHFDTDYERAELLIDVGSKLANSADVRQAWLDAALGISADYERRRTLESMLTRSGFDDSQLGSVIDASDSMGSDYEHRELLIAAIARASDVDALAPAYTRSTQSMGSDYERREALLALVNAGKLGPRGIKAVLDSAAQMGSDFECRQVLVALAHVMPNDVGSIERYHQVAQHLSDDDRDEAERALRR